MAPRTVLGSTTPGGGVRRRLLRRRPHQTDLFDLFPDLPRPWRPTYADQLQRTQESIQRMQRRVRLNVEHHRAEAAAITAKYRRKRQRS